MQSIFDIPSKFLFCSEWCSHANFSKTPWGEFACNNICRNFKFAAFVVFISLFVWGFSSHSRIFHSYGDITITDEGLQILINAAIEQWGFLSLMTWVCRWWDLNTQPAYTCGTNALTHCGSTELKEGESVTRNSVYMYSVYMLNAFKLCCLFTAMFWGEFWGVLSDMEQRNWTPNQACLLH